MAVAECPDYFLHHPNYQDNVDHSSSQTSTRLLDYKPSAGQNFSNHTDDDVDLEALVNDLASVSPYEGLYSVCRNQDSDSDPLLHNGHGLHGNKATPPQRPPTSRGIASKVRRSQPMHILAVREVELLQRVSGLRAALSYSLCTESSREISFLINQSPLRRLQEEELQVRPASLPAIPNPFPELCSPAGSPTLSPASQTPDIHVVRVLAEDGVEKVLEVPADMTAGDVCQLLVCKSHCLDDNCWSLVEQHRHLGLERCVEDHELVVQVQSCMSSESKFLFRKNYIKYQFFSEPLNFFPEQMVAWCEESNSTIPPSQLLQNFLNSSRCPEIQGFLYLKESGRRSWRKFYAFLRRSGLYCSTKGTSKEPRHLQLLSDLEESNIFTVTTARKLNNAPTEHQFCIKPCRSRVEPKEIKMLCAEDEQSRTCWITAFRVLKYGVLLYQNYKIPQRRNSAVSSFSTPVRSVSENSLVAMDFSGRTGRVIDNPMEAMSAAVEEGHNWRKRGQRMNVLGSSSPLHASSISSVIHRTQLWFHGRMVREESHRLIMQQGRVDGFFLVRESQSNPKAFVLTMCHHQKIRHFQILPYEEGGQVFFSLDDGSTKFTDLIHLVEFYQLNRGVLPCKLKYPCTMVAL